MCPCLYDRRHVLVYMIKDEDVKGQGKNLNGMFKHERYRKAHKIGEPEYLSLLRTHVHVYLLMLNTNANVYLFLDRLDIEFTLEKYVKLVGTHG